MSSVYTAFKDGYAREQTYAATGIVDEDATAYLWGSLSQKSVHPSPRTTIHYRATGLNAYEVPAGELWKSFFELHGMYGFGVQNGIFLEAIMGASSTAGSDPYTHTITTPTDGSTLPSFTIQHERTGTATAWATQYTGCKVANLLLTASFEQRFLIARLDYIAKKAVDPGFVLVNDPALHATANTAPYHWGGLSRKWDNVELHGLTKIDINISPDFEVERAHTWDTGVYTGQWIQSLLESPRRKYEVTMTYHPQSDDIWDELVSTGNTKDLILKWTRSANDYIQATLTDCQVTWHEQLTPEVGTTLTEEVTFEPRSITFEVKDSIAGSAYGE